MEVKKICYFLAVKENYMYRSSEKEVTLTSYSTFVLFFSVIKRNGWDTLEKPKLFDILVVTNDDNYFSLE